MSDSITNQETPLGYLHVITEPGTDEPSRIYSASADNPWSHWVEKYKDQCHYTCTPLYARSAVQGPKETPSEDGTWFDLVDACATRADKKPLHKAVAAFVEAIKPVKRELIDDQNFTDEWDAMVNALAPSSQPRAAEEAQPTARVQVSLPGGRKVEWETKEDGTHSSVKAAADIQQGSAENTTAVAEICSDSKGNILWIEKWIFNRKEAVGATFIRDSKEYRVLHSAVTFGKHGGALVEHVVERTSK